MVGVRDKLYRSRTTIQMHRHANGAALNYQRPPLVTIPIQRQTQ